MRACQKDEHVNDILCGMKAFDDCLVIVNQLFQMAEAHENTAGMEASFQAFKEFYEIANTREFVRVGERDWSETSQGRKRGSDYG